MHPVRVTVAVLWEAGLLGTCATEDLRLRLRNYVRAHDDTC